MKVILRDKLGWPVVGHRGAPFLNGLRYIIHTCLIQTCKRWNEGWPRDNGVNSSLAGESSVSGK